MNTIIPIALVDDHILITSAIKNLINQNKEYNVIFTSKNGEEFIEMIQKAEELPKIVLMDINMPFVSGIEATIWLKKNYPEILVIALTMEEDEKNIISMINAGAKGYLLKDSDPELLFKALEMVNLGISFYPDYITKKIIQTTKDSQKIVQFISSLKEREKEFIKFACSELTYKEIANKMCLSPKTIDGYRESVFLKLEVKTRVGLVLFAIKNDKLLF